MEWALVERVLDPELDSILTLPIASCVILGNLIHISEPQFAIGQLEITLIEYWKYARYFHIHCLIKPLLAPKPHIR